MSDNDILTSLMQLWYYGWLLFSSLFAAMHAVIAIIFIVRARGNYAGTLDLQSRKHDTVINSLYILRKHGNTTDVFRKIAIRCICYPLGKLLFDFLKVFAYFGV